MNAFVYRWGLGINDSSYGLVDQNVLYNWAGAGIALQSGSETQNVISRNFISHIFGSNGGPADRGFRDVGVEGGGIWSAALDTTYTNNVVADSLIGYDITAPQGATYLNVPVSPGADPTLAGGYRTVDTTVMPIRSFVGNEVYGGLTETGMYLWSIGIGHDRWNPDPNTPESVIKDMKLWNVSTKGYYGYLSNHLTFDGLVARDDSQLVGAGKSYPYMFFSGDYIQSNFTVKNSDVQGFGIGWNPASVGVHQQMVNTYMRNYKDVVVTPPWWIQAAEGLTFARDITLQNVHFDPLNVPQRYGAQGFVVMDVDPGRMNQNLMASTVVKVFQYQGDPTANFRLYFNEEAASAIVPQSQFWENTTLETVHAAPEAGLTGAQVWAKYGIAIGGALAPTTATTKANIVGLVAPITG
jgi:hypothetical protein